MKYLCLYISLLLGGLAAQAQPFEIQKKENKVVIPLEKSPELEYKGTPINLRVAPKKCPKKALILQERAI